jgi:hypothetical protein
MDRSDRAASIVLASLYLQCLIFYLTVYSVGHFYRDIYFAAIGTIIKLSIGLCIVANSSTEDCM